MDTRQQISEYSELHGAIIGVARVIGTKKYKIFFWDGSVLNIPYDSETIKGIKSQILRLDKAPEKLSEIIRHCAGYKALQAYKRTSLHHLITAAEEECFQ